MSVVAPRLVSEAHVVCAEKTKRICVSVSLWMCSSNSAENEPRIFSRVPYAHGPYAGKATVPMRLFDPGITRWSCGNITLLGDACHPTTPNNGQGACMAIEDAFVLATLLGEYWEETDGHVEAFYLYEVRGV